MFGGHFLTEHLSDRNASRAEAHQLNARLHVVVSEAGDTSFARDLKQDTPEATVVFRPYFADDKRWPDTGKTAEQVWEEHRGYAVEGLAVQVGNEIGYSPAWIAMVTQIAGFARQEGKQVALPTPGVGNYAEGDIAGGGLDPLLLALAADLRGMGSANPPNLLAAHEYAQQSTLSEQPYRIGRVQWMLDRAAGVLKKPLDPNRVAITEFGRDVGGNALTDGGLVYFNGDEQAFYDFLTPGALRYRLSGFLGAALYCQGITWPSFNWERRATLIRLMAAWNAAHPAQAAQPYPAGTSPHSLRVVLGGVRLRSAPSLQAAILRPLVLHEVVTVYGAPKLQADGHDWARVTTTRNEQGWSALSVNGLPSFAPLSAPLPIPVTPKPDFALRIPVIPPGHLSQPFGGNTTGVVDFYTRWGLPAHEGTDYGGASGAPIFAAADGIVKAINLPGHGGIVLNHAYGIHVKLMHTDAQGQTWETDYCHLSAVDSDLIVGQAVTVGQRLGSMGQTGNAIGVHLHLMLRRAGNTAAGVKMRLADGTFALYPNDIVNAEPYLGS